MSDEDDRLKAIWQMLLRFEATAARTDLVVEVGSTAHNISAGSDDLDVTAVWTERYTDLMQLDPSHSTKMLRTKPEGQRSEPGDIDMNVYSMRKFVSLCTKGNPSILNTLFIVAPDKVIYERAPFPRKELAELSHTKSAGRAYLGYLDSQLGRWTGEKGQRRVNRPELIERYGFDVKYAAQTIRLGVQGQEFLTTGEVTIPMEESVAAALRNLRSGGMEESYALEWAYDVRARLSVALDTLTLPEGPDASKVREFLADWHWERHVKDARLLNLL